jgi:hypothetical protein
VPGVIAILLALFVVGPIAVFVGGAIWSALMGWLESEDADENAATQDSASA